MDGYLARLSKLSPAEVEKSWLRRHCRTARERREALRHLDTLEEAASLCDDPARRALTEKFEGTLPRIPIAWNRDQDDRFLDVVVELAAYRWLRTEHPGRDLVYVFRAEGRSPDLEVRTGAATVGVECKNKHMSKDVSAALDAGDVVSGSVALSQAFVEQLREKLVTAMQQLAGYELKMVFLHVTPDPDHWMIESEVGNAIRDIVPAGCRVVVFLNYDWSEPRWVFG